MGAAASLKPDDGGGGGSGGAHDGADPTVKQVTMGNIIEMLRNHSKAVLTAIKEASVDELSEVKQLFCFPVDLELDHKLEIAAVLPEETKLVVDNKVPDTTERFKITREVTLPWVLRAVPHAHASDPLRDSLRRVLGSVRGWVQAKSFKPLQEATAQNLRRLGEYLHRTQFEVLDLGKKLGTYQPKVTESPEAHQFVPPMCVLQSISQAKILARRLASSRQVGNGATLQQKTNTNQHSTAVLPHLGESVTNDVSVLTELTGYSGEPLAIFLQDWQEKEYIYIHFLRLMASAVDVAFREHINRLVGHLLVDGQMRAAPVKSYARMVAKMVSPDDHGNKSFPRPRFNIDCVRGLATFDTPGDMLAALQILETEFGGFTKFKNGMSWDANESAKRFHLNTIIATMLFAHPVHTTFGQLRKDPSVRAIWDDYLEVTKPPDARVVPRNAWFQHAQKALEWIAAVPAETPFAMHSELQCVLRTYRNTRERMHEGYRIVRAVDDTALRNDYSKFATRARETDDLVHDGRTKYLMACRDGIAAACVRLIPSSGGSISETQSHRDRVDGFIVACKYVRPKCVEALMPFIDDVDALGTYQGTALIWLCRGTSARWQFSLDEARQQILLWLLARGASVNNSANTSTTPVIEAAKNGRRGLLRILLQCRGDVEAAGHKNSPLGVAADYGHQEIVRMLLAAGADPNSHDNAIRRQAPLCESTSSCHVQVTLDLLAAKADPNIPDSNNCTNLLGASQTGSVAIIAVLLEQPDVSLDKQDDDGDTALTAAAAFGRTGCVKLLLQAKADHTLVNNDGDTALSYAQHYNHTRCVELLRAADNSRK